MHINFGASTKRIIHIFLYLFFIVIFIFGLYDNNFVNAQNLADKLKGKILLQVEQNGEAWYINPTNQRRYYLGRPDDAFQLMRKLGIGITNNDLWKIPIADANLSGNIDSDEDGLSDMIEDSFGTSNHNADTDGDGHSDKTEILNGYSPTGNIKFGINSNFANSQKGKILLQVEQNGEAWYVNPDNSKRYFLGRAVDAFKIMRSTGLGITNTNLNKINIAEDNNFTQSLSPKSTDSCSTECLNIGSKECFNSVSYKVCGNYDADSCLEWGPANSCAANTVCQGGFCASNDVVHVDNSSNPATSTPTSPAASQGCTDGVFCNGSQECINKQCVLKNQKKHFGVLYVYESENTYNSNWRAKFEDMFSNKIPQALLSISNNKIHYSFDILGAVHTTKVCWNPKKIIGSYKSSYKKIDLSNNNIIFERHGIDDVIAPGSEFGIDSLVINSSKWVKEENNNFYEFTSEWKDLDLKGCSNCKVVTENVTKEWQQLFPKENYSEVINTVISINCENNITKIASDYDLLKSLKVEAADILNFNMNDYDEILVIFGKAGVLLPLESEENYKLRCHRLEGYISGWSNLIFVENALLSDGEFINCSEKGYGGNAWYEPVGWKAVVHEFLHPLGAVDIYDTGTIFGYNSPAYYRAEALKIDPLADESIMGNKNRECQDKAEKIKEDICSYEELNRVYLDNYNKQRIGIK